MNHDSPFDGGATALSGLGVPLPVVEMNLQGAMASSQAIILVEGISDRLAVETLAVRLGRHLDEEGIAVVAIGGATNIGHVLRLVQDRELRLGGLCDAGEETAYARALEQTGFGGDLTRPSMEALGFYVCVLDLEDELIRALGPGRVEQLMASEEELGSFRVFQKQPAQRGRSLAAQQRRFLGTRSGRKIRYASLLVNALELDSVPSPLSGVIAGV